KLFFQNTHPAKQLCAVTGAVFGRLANPKDAGITVRLSTGFGGGKSHTLMAFWHLAKHVDAPGMGTELLPAAGRPSSVTAVGIDAGKAGVPDFASHGKVVTHSLWGELFYRLGGERTLKALGRADDPEASPNEDQVRAVIPSGPVLILLDEIVIYMAKLSERAQGNLLGFLNTLTAVVTKRPQTALVVTDPAGQAVYAKLAAKIAEAVPGAAAKLDEVFGRKMSDFDPIGGEAAQVIVRRLFEKIDPPPVQAASATYHALYRRVAEEAPGLLPAGAATADYARRIVECYPFHPRLLDTAQERLGALQDFQKSRGVLRLFARIIRDVWESGQDHELISAGDLDWSSPRIQSDLLHRLNRDNFKAAVSADIEGHAAELDGGAPRGIHRRVASALLLESLPMQPNSGLDPAELTLAMLRPDEAGPEPSEALDRLAGACWHTYPMPGGRGWQFRYEPNIIRQIEERKAYVPVEDARSRVLAEVQRYFGGPTFKLAAWPTKASQVKEITDLQLVLCETEAIARAVCAYADDTDPAAPIPRRFLNAIVAVTAAMEVLDRAIDVAQTLLAADAIEQEHRIGDASKLIRDQLQRIRPNLHKQFRARACLGFNRVVLPGGQVFPLTEEFQVSEEEVLRHDRGQAAVREFLEAKGMLYRPGEALDVHRFLTGVLPGATPLVDQPEVYTARAVHERFLSAPGLRLIPDGAVVRQTVLKAVADGKLVVRLADGRAYDAHGVVEGPDGGRRRGTGILTALPLDDSVWITKSDSEAGRAWVREDKPDEREPWPPPPPPPPPPPFPVVYTWKEAHELAAVRSLLTLTLTATSPAAAAPLLGMVQPLGAERITLSVTVGGNLKDGGTMYFMASGVRPTHPTKPLQTAQVVFNALQEGAMFEAELGLHFGDSGRSGMQAALQRAADTVPPDVKVRVEFGPPSGGAA
ncbi:MAG: DUF499 domain-containing protein, partial [bacterium]|nr:DUF499 domain-containing protein [bacterium]